MKSMFFTKASEVNMHCPYFIGISYGVIASIANSNKKRRQVRIGLVFWHVGVTFNL